MSESPVSRIKFALHHATWRRGIDSRAALHAGARKVTPGEYATTMDRHLFCPGCFEPLIRTPKGKDYFKNGRVACFAHLPADFPIPCDLRSTKPEGLKFETEEEALQAIASNDLVVVSDFLSEPAPPLTPTGLYDQTPVEDQSGGVADVPISRHSGKPFRLPTRVSTVESICRRFDVNLYRYFIFPGSNVAFRLLDILTDVRKVTEPTEVPSLYFWEDH
jgi:hypothetical protein